KRRRVLFNSSFIIIGDNVGSTSLFPANFMAAVWSLQIGTHGCRVPAMSNDQFEVDVRDVPYQHQANKAWLARIYQPKGTGPFPTIIDVHGGAWHNGDRTNNAGIDQALAAKGILVAAVDFRQPPE